LQELSARWEQDSSGRRGDIPGADRLVEVDLVFDLHGQSDSWGSRSAGASSTRSHRRSCWGQRLQGMRPRRSYEPRTRILVCLALLFLRPFQSPAREVPPDYAGASISQLIDELVKIDEPTAGIHSTLVFTQFLAEDAPPELQGGVLGSRIVTFADPLLVAHLYSEHPEQAESTRPGRHGNTGASLPVRGRNRLLQFQQDVAGTFASASRSDHAPPGTTCPRQPRKIHASDYQLIPGG